PEPESQARLPALILQWIPDSVGATWVMPHPSGEPGLPKTSISQAAVLSDQRRPGRETPSVLGQTDDVEAYRQVAPPAERHRVPARAHSIDAARLHLTAAHVEERQLRRPGVPEAEAHPQLMLRRVGR